MNANKQVLIFIVVIVIFLTIGGISLILYQKKMYSDTFFKYSGFAVHKVSDGPLEEYEITLYIGENKQPYVINSRYNPKDLEGIKIYDNIRKDLVKEKLYITMEPNLSSKAVIAFAEIDKYFENPYIFNLPTFPALIREIANNTLPVITCNDVTSTTSVIFFKIGEKNEIYNQQGCVVLEAITEEDLIKLADRLSLTALGVMSGR